MTSTNYTINWDSVNSGGEDTGSSTNFILRDTIGEQATGFTTSTNYTLSAGYRVGDQDLSVLSFAIGTQENATEVAFTAFSTSSETVTVTSAVGFSIGDLVGVVENVGLSQIIAVGEITNIAGTVITVDDWDGSPSLMSAAPSGGDDFAYRLNGSSAQLETLTATIGKTSLTATRVSSNATNGYTVYINDDNDLRVNTSTFIANVSDGTVTIGTEEYGARVFGSMATSTGSDFAFSTSTVAIQQSTSTTAAEERVGIVYKAAVGAGTPAGNYSHNVFYTLTANY